MEKRTQAKVGAAEPPPQVRPGGGLAGVVARAIELPTVPAVAQRVMKAVEDPNMSAPKLAKIVEADQGLTAKVLRISNSAMYGRPRQITNLQGAVVLLGFNEVKDLVLVSSTRQLYKRFGPREKAMWEHSVGVAICSHVIAQRFAPALREAAFLAGQMHDIGKVVLNNQNPVNFGEAERLGAESGSVAAEQEVFMFTHTDVGAMVSAKWNMPAGVEAVCMYHHDLSLAHSVAADQALLVACVTLANFICHKLQVGAPEPESSLLPDAEDAMSMLGLDMPKVDALLENFQEKYMSEILLFS